MKESEVAKLVDEYVEHLHARVRASGKTDVDDDAAFLSTELSGFCTREPKACLDLILRTLERELPRHAIAAIGDGLLENLLNENSAAIADEVAHELKNNRRFRQAFAFGNHASVDPAIVEDWVAIFQRLGTTKDAERKSLWRKE